MPSLTSCQKKALKILKEGKENIFLTGSAGSGKSFLVQEFLRGLDRKRFPVLASTGAAAVLIGGRTFHSFFGLGVMEGGARATLDRAMQDRRLASRLRKMEGFVLDEVSMIGGETFCTAEAICRGVRENDLPWGGVRVITVGDFAQLPPVSKTGERKDWAFLEESWERSGLRPVILRRIVRSKDEEYLEILNQVREGEIGEGVKSYLSARTLLDQEEREVTYLLSRRVQVEKINHHRLSQVPKRLKEIPTEYSGVSEGIVQLQKSAPIPEKLLLKEGALVMTRVNDPAFRFINGSVGHVVQIEPETIVVHFPKKGDVEIEKTLFSLLDPEGEIIASAKNFPLNLAYALTIHKAQGTTLDAIVTELRGLWEPGHAYVALSRLRSGAGLTLTGWEENSIRTDPEVRSFHHSIESGTAF